MKKIINTQVNVFFPKVVNQREKFLSNEKILNDYFLNATVISIPEQIQEEIPRIITQTKGGHSTLSLSLNRATFSTNYNGKYCEEWDLCKEYISKRIEKINELVDILTDKRKYFVGLTVAIEYSDLRETGLDMMKKSFFGNNKTLERLYNSRCDFVFVEDEKYYLNIIMQNGRKSINQYGNIINGELSNSIIVNIDMNDRYARNEDLTYNSDIKNIDDILLYVGNFINSKLENIVQNGKFD